jgi:hypothetical protein
VVLNNNLRARECLAKHMAKKRREKVERCDNLKYFSQ